ncbi:MAG TPA: TonB-dependent receptor [Bryobacteraceae bacterium]|nr:TonB-dependent receptor [Bryobacteraceae bacterium]
MGVRKQWSRVFAVSVGLLCCAAGWPPLRGQQDAGAATLAGSVLDQTGKAIQDATVVLKNEATGLTRTVTTESDGHFSASGLPSGAYTVEAGAAGFARSTRSGIQVAASGTEDISIPLSVASVNQAVTVTETTSVAAQLAPAGNTLDATSAKTAITGAFIRNFTSPVSDFAEILNMAPGTFSLNPNGVGLGQGKTYFRGFQDGQYTMTFDGIPFEDTNSPTHHSWANFPAQWIGGVDFDRSPGQASTFGPTNFGGSINLLSPDLQPSQDIRVTAAYGSFNTRLLQLDYDSGQFGPGNKNSLLLDVHQLLSDGYQTFNRQKRDAGSGKYQYRFSEKTAVTVYGGLVDIWNNTPNTTNPTRAQVAQFGDTFLLSGDPGTPTAPNPYYYGYNFYHVQTDFEYVDFNSDLGDGWRFDTKAFTTRYWNKQNYQNGPTVNISTAKPSGVDKLNGYRHAGDTAILTKESKWGVFRTGIWYDWAYTDRYQIPSNILTWADTPLGNFHEHFITQTLQPFAEFEWRPTQKLVITAGIKDANYKMTLNQYQDNGKTVGCLGGVAAIDPATGAPICVGGGAFTTHSIDYNNWLPTITARYRAWRNWSVYAQFAEGSVIPPSNVFDVKNGVVLTPPKPTLAKTYQTGSVVKFNRWTLDVDAYYVHFQNGYDSYLDPVSTENVFVATGPSNTKGIEGESNILIGHGLSLYLNGSVGSAKYQTGRNFPNGGLWVANTPKNTEAAGLFWQLRNWDVGIFNKRVGPMYNDNGSLNYLINGISVPYPVDQAISINPFDVTNVFVNYTVKNSSWLRGSKLGLAVNNLLNSHNVVGVTPFTAATASVPFAPNALDQLNLLPGRSVMVSLTVGYAPKR